MNHYCTYFDRGFLAQGLALWRSLERHDPTATLWVLALDDFAAAVMNETGGGGVRVVRLAEIEAGDAALAAAKANRSRIDYVFTLSPCWPRWLLARHPEIERLTYLDADLFFFGRPREIFAAMDAARASVLITAHRFPEWLRRYERHGKFNVGFLSFRNDGPGRACLDDWRAQCLAWCHDRLEDGKYADQKYLDEWPAKLGAQLLVLDRAGVNLAPWNWANHDFVQRTWVDDGELVLFHFARFRPRCGDWWWHSGQLEYGVMPRRLRRAIYAPYARALLAARDEIRARRPEFDFVRRPARSGRDFWQNLPRRLLFGGDWLRVGDEFLNLRLGLGRWSARIVFWLRRLSPNR
ncbi:MAG: hypothetical protein HZA93_28415 [Verrucomicrobia bacterium]|nr:hypothetical protein [Verrucomicrobiota bacterium]